MDLIGYIIDLQLKLETFVGAQNSAQLIPRKHLAVDNNIMYAVIRLTIFKPAHNLITLQAGVFHAVGVGAGLQILF